MALMTWKDEYSVKVRAIDAQHRKLVDLLNQIHDATSAGRGKDVVGKVLAELVMYTRVHFLSEEELLRRHGYPGYLQQKAEHDQLVRRVLEYQTEFASCRVGLPIEVMQFLRDWLTGHIQGLDKQYSAFLNGKGVS